MLHVYFLAFLSLASCAGWERKSFHRHGSVYMLGMHTFPFSRSCHTGNISFFPATSFSEHTCLVMVIYVRRQLPAEVAFPLFLLGGGLFVNA